MDKPSKIDAGACADIFALPDGRILKAYRRRAHTNGVAPSKWADHDAVTRAQYRAEARAYDLLNAVQALEIYTPQYYGRVDPLHCLGPAQNGNQYIAGCGLLLERIPGKAQKLAHLEGLAKAEAAKIIERIGSTLGLNQVWDASCFVPGTRAPFAIIDFAYWNAEKYEMILADKGVLGPEMRIMLERENVG